MNENASLMGHNDAAAYLHITPRTLYGWRYRGVGPKFLKLGGKVLYRPTDLDAWISARIHDPEAAQ